MIKRLKKNNVKNKRNLKVIEIIDFVLFNSIYFLVFRGQKES